MRTQRINHKKGQETQRINHNTSLHKQPKRKTTSSKRNLSRDMVHQILPIGFSYFLVFSHIKVILNFTLFLAGFYKVFPKWGF